MSRRLPRCPSISWPRRPLAVPSAEGVDSSAHAARRRFAAGVPGYDKALRPVPGPGRGLILRPVKDKPTRADALAALASLKEPVKEFPFVADATEDFEGDKSASRSVALSAILTGLIRRTLPTAPLHGFDAPEAGSGKGLCCNIIAIIVTGTRASMMNFATSDTEFRKALFAALLANDLVITLDNIAPGRQLDGDTLNTALTERTCMTNSLVIARWSRCRLTRCSWQTGIILA